MATDKAIANAMKAAYLELSVELKEHQKIGIEAVLKGKDFFGYLAHRLWKVYDTCISYNFCLYVHATLGYQNHQLSLLWPPFFH